MAAIFNFTGNLSGRLARIPEPETVPADGYYTKIETDAAIEAAIAAVVGGAPAVLDTLKEIADVIGTETGSGAAGILKRVADLESGKADKAEMSVVPVAGSSDKTTIQLKSGTSATVLTAHQDISGKVDKNKTTVVAGLGATATGDGAVAVGPVRANGQGAGASAEGDTSVALGYWSRATAFGAVQVGYGVNSTQNSFQFRAANLFVESDGAVRLGAGFPAATTTAPGSMSAADKAKLNGIAAGATAVSVDSALSQTSENPVQNKVVAAALAQKQDALGFTPENAANKKTLPDTRPSSTNDYPTSQSVFDTIDATRNRLFVAAEFLGKWVQSALRWTDVSGNVHLLTMITHNHTSGLRTAGNDAYATLYFVDADAWYAASSSSQRENVAYAEVKVYMGGASGTVARVNVTMYNGGSLREYAQGLRLYLGYSRTIVTNVSEDPADPHGSVELVPLAISSQVSDALALKANAADLPYALVEPGKWEFGELPSGTSVDDPFWDTDRLMWGLSVNGDAPLWCGESENALSLEWEYGDGSITITATRALLPGHLCDRAGNHVVVTDDTTLTLPAAVPGYIRDFLVRLEISGSTVPTITFQGQGSEAPNGADEITYETDGDEFPVPDEAGTWLYSFTETAAHTFAVSLKKINTVAQGGS